MPVNSHKVQLETMHSSKQSDSERDFEEKQAWSKVVSKEKEACSSTDFERSVASKHAQRPLRLSKSKLEQ